MTALLGPVLSTLQPPAQLAPAITYVMLYSMLVCYSSDTKILVATPTIT